jgi:CRISPR/Cas system-associated exonuclease Cas4 (RecB family)
MRIKSHLYSQKSKEPFKISRSKIDMFLNCQRCFYLDRVLGITQPPGYPFSLNSAVDHLLKKEFDIHRAKNTRHPLMEAYGLDAIPYSHEMLNEWRENFKGMRYLHKPTNLLITGAVDDIWIDNKTKELIVVDYKATSKDAEVTLDADWQIGYKRQMEVYQWLLRQLGFPVSNTGYFVYCNGRKDNKSFDGKLEFNIKLIPYKGNGDWIEKAILDIKKCLDSKKVPESPANCEYCQYVDRAKNVS